MINGNPFAPACSRQSFLETLGAGEALRRLNDGLGAREPFLLVIGESGTGKTTLVHEASARWDSRVAMVFLACPALTGPELLEEIVLRFGGQPLDGVSRPKLMASLERSLMDIASSGKLAMLVVDDAHTLSPSLLQELRSLVNATQQAQVPLEVLLIGLPALETALDDPALAALRQRVSVRVKLEPLSAGETRRYIRHRVTAAGGDGSSVFSRQTCMDIAALTRGLPRQINTLAGEALRLAQASGLIAVQSDHVRLAAAALWGAIPTQTVEIVDDEDGEEPQKLTPPARMPAPKAAPPRVEEVAPPKVAARPLEVAAPKPRARDEESPAPKTRPVAAPRAASAPAPVEDYAPPPKPVSQDPHEWVSRFVGEDGPVRIGSKAMEASWEPEPYEPPAASTASAQSQPSVLSAPSVQALPSPTEAPAKPRTSPAHPPVRPLRRFRLHVATTATLVTIVVVAAFALVIWAGGTARRNAERPLVTSAVSTSGIESRAEKGTPEASNPARASKAPLISPNGRYTLDVGGFLDLQTAYDERDRMQSLTGIQGWVVPAAEGEGKPNRIVLGIFHSRDRATGAANMLMRSKTLPSVTVIPLPPRSARR